MKAKFCAGGRAGVQVAAVAVMAMAAAPMSRATVLALEEFNYSTGELNTQNGGTAWGAAWGTDPIYTEVVASGLSYTDPATSSVLGDVGNAAQLSTFQPPSTVANSPSQASRTIGSAPQSGSSLFLSFLIRYTPTSGGSASFSGNDRAFLWLGDSGIAANSPVSLGFAGDTVNEFSVRLSNGSAYTETKIGGQLAASTTYFMVARVTKTASVYDRLEFWLNPEFTLTEFLTPDATVTIGSGGLSSIAKIGYGGSGLDLADVLEFDRIVLGTELTDVVPIVVETPVPEPGTMAVGALMVLAGGGYYFRRNRTARA